MRATLIAGIFLLCAGPVLAQELGAFDGQSDVGMVTPPGTAVHDAASGDYVITSAGANIWARVDGFHYLWKKMSGDAVLTADITFPPITYNHPPVPHRKAVLMFRQSLDPGAAQVSAHLHGVGMTALQYRRERGANTESTELNIDAPRTLRLEKRGDVYTLFLSMKGEPLHPVGASVKLHLAEPFYVGLGVSSHDPATTDKIVFHNVKLEMLPPSAPPAKLVQNSTLQIIQTEDGARRAIVIATGPDRVSSPDWMRAGKALYAYREGQITRIPLLDPLNGGKLEVVDTAGLVDCAGDYGVSPDGQAMALSCAEDKGGVRNLYVLPLGGKPRRLTQGQPSYFHGWSADGTTLLFTRGKVAAADFFTVPAAGGAETRLTSDTRNDGPEFTPDGKYIYFDSSRSGSSQIWRMNADGTGAQQITDDGMVDQSPHVSPDGKTVAFLQMAPDGGTGLQDASIQLLSVSDGLVRTLTRFQGNRGSFTMPVWGDNNHLAFVSYQMLPAKQTGATQ
jgi:TolB protein